jgi:hypothetical protein
MLCVISATTSPRRSATPSRADARRATALLELSLVQLLECVFEIYGHTGKMCRGTFKEAGKPMTSSTADGGMEPPDWPDPDPDHVLTWRQQRILQVIRHFAECRRYAPTVREIGEAAELASPSSVSYQLSILQRKGYLRRTPGRPRTIELRLPGQPTVRLEAGDLADAVDLPSLASAIQL